MALLASPLLGPSVWQPVAQALARNGVEAVSVAHRGPAPRCAREVLEQFLGALDEDVDWVLVPHSNAGLYVPALSRHRRVAAAVFVDARLPERAPSFPMSSAASLAFLADKTDENGLLPPWSQWWQDDIAALFPDEETRARAEQEMRRLPLAYFEDSMDGSNREDLPGAYLAYGDTYKAERGQAALWGWPVATIEGEHLQMVMDPDQTAQTIIKLMQEMGVLPGH
ncbi:hypothetical protein ACIP98_37130 [Streptomyces sp. NPDC088354]|uniref:hypothetical protein n=1 Tax=Streptomyces sp. NPDC088354 TaxID=3365856 RepID=UPI00381144D5